MSCSGAERDVVLVADPYPPYQYVDEGKIKGFDHDVISAVFRQMGYQTKTVLLPWEECLEHLDRREAHAAFQVARTPERERRYLFSRLLRRAETALFAREGVDLQIKPLIPLDGQLRAIRVGLMAGYSYHPAIDGLAAYRAASPEELLRGAADGQADVVVVDTGVAEYLMQKLDLPRLKRVEGFSVVRDLHVVFRKDCRQLLEQFDVQLGKAMAEGVPGRIAETYRLI